MANYELEGESEYLLQPVCVVHVILHYSLLIVQETLCIHVFSQLDYMTPEEKAELGALFVEMIVDASMAFCVVDNPAVKAFVAKLRSAYKLPTRRDVSAHVSCAFAFACMLLLLQVSTC